MAETVNGLCRDERLFSIIFITYLLANMREKMLWDKIYWSIVILFYNGLIKIR